MKYFILIAVMLFGAGIAASSQTKSDTTEVRYNDVYDNFSRPTGSVQAATINAGGLIRSQTPSTDMALRQTLVIIDNKIYSAEDKEFRELDKSRIKTMNIIKDENSKGPIKYVIMITTK